jgi:hypothetical protein
MDLHYPGGCLALALSINTRQSRLPQPGTAYRRL